jgi:DNA-binding response OmpR family regulator
MNLPGMARVLIIDDDPDVRTVMNILLKKQGYEVETASRQEEVFEMITSFHPTVILLDVLLSGADGRKICQDIKSNTSTSHIPVIMFSAHPGAADNINVYGADDFISKPVNADTLLQKVQRQVEQAQQ